MLERCGILKEKLDIDDIIQLETAEFYVSGFTRAIDEESESPVF